MTDTQRPVATVVGVGPGLGAALARRFARGYALALVARDAAKLGELAREIEASHDNPRAKERAASSDGQEPAGPARAIAVPADVSSAEEIHAAFARIRAELGDTDVLLYNAAMRPFGRLLETTPSTFENTWRVCAFGAFLCSQEVVPGMLARGRGAIVFTGATAGTKPFAASAAFGPAKFALRGLAQVMARDLGPRGVHVAYANIDGAIDMPFIRQLAPQLTEEDLLGPAAIADSYWHLVHQHRSAWTQELDLRPFKEKF